MGRTGGESHDVANKKDEIDSLLKSHNKSKRATKQKISEAICQNENEAKKVAKIQLDNLARACGDDDYNVATVIPFYHQDPDHIDKVMEPLFQSVEDSFLAVADTFVLNQRDVSHPESASFMAECSRCESVINTEVLLQRQRAKRSCVEYQDVDFGVCPVCKTTSDEEQSPHIPIPTFNYSCSEFGGGYYGQQNFERQCANNSQLRAEYDEKHDKLSSLLSKIGKRPRIQQHTRARMFNNLAFRPLLKQPAHSNALNLFKTSVAQLLPALDTSQGQHPKDSVKFLVSTSWCSRHDEWQDNSDMDEY